ncbi:putative beta-lysine N-acetyltransferase [Heliorestis convoluta]|uniref:Putative beta-lysine N-acetyltransferase n=1 Tax=Heliorestis convoluta TaxID=356322 RepID=A0A5Q2N3I0_9FIRM|nr:putative beta-lysine N-acetyltransferase [Heliorestis convoluta]QGG48423.1 putative beta-lysine N-acetyltransferase [Heliorestis convoluta]
MISCKKTYTSENCQRDYKAYATSNLQKDPHNRRLIVTSIRSPISPKSTPKLRKIARNEGLEKIWLWTSVQDLGHWLDQGFVLEGIVESHIDEKTLASLAYYIDQERGVSKNLEAEQKVLQELTKRPIKNLSPIPDAYEIRSLQRKDSFAISGLLKEVFASYPSPVENPSYIQELFSKGCLFAGVFHQGKLVSMAATYPEREWQGYEITDCATHPEHRGLSLTERLIPELEKEIKESGPYCCYTLARATSFGINRVFYKLGYRFQGRLINNCHIAGDFEDMNLWVKP